MVNVYYIIHQYHQQLSVPFLRSTGAKYDMLIVDVDNKETSLGISCPPPSFLEEMILKSCHEIVSPKGDLKIQENLNYFYKLSILMVNDIILCMTYYL